MCGKKKKIKPSKDPIPNPQYICQYKLQSIVFNVFNNKELIAYKTSLHNQLNIFIYFSSVVEEVCMNPVLCSSGFLKIPRFFRILSGSCLMVPKNLGILGDLGLCKFYEGLM